MAVRIIDWSDSDPRMRARHIFAVRYAVLRGWSWDIEQLSPAQIGEICCHPLHRRPLPVEIN